MSRVSQTEVLMAVFFQPSTMCSQPINPVNDDPHDDDFYHGDDDSDDEEKHLACAASLSGLSPNTS